MITLQNDSFRLDIDPVQGGKPTALRAGGRQWLWENPHLPAQPFAYGDAWIRTLDTGGWDEVIPSVLPERIAAGDGTRAMDVPDHGDLVSLPWRIEDATESSARLAVDARCAPFRLVRELSLEGPVLHARYTLEHTGRTGAIPWLWAAHPEFSLPAGASIYLDPATPVLVRFGFGTGTRHAGRAMPWSELIAAHGGHASGLWTLPLQDELPPEGFAVKLFTARQSHCRRASLVLADGSALAVEIDSDTLPHLGFWINLGAWSGAGTAPYRNLVIEPTTAPHDSLNDAIKDGTARYLRPGQSVDWAFRFSR